MPWRQDKIPRTESVATPLWLFADAETGDNRPVPRDVFFLQVIQQATPSSDHPQQTSARMVIFGMNLEVLGQISNFRTQNGDLHFRRTGVGAMCPIGSNEFCFSFCCQ